ncbi:MAG: octaprenyl diphosphate synthase [Pantoea sp. Brub]|nr:octaprenyl diphosphate synthase [Pantoea sp. Brub]
MKIEQINKLLAVDINAINKIILENLHSNVSLIQDVTHHIINGGKNIRPIIVLLSAKAIGYSGNLHILSAALIEIIHNATLLHDDIIDNSNTRRGKKSANALFGNSASILIGDFMYARAFQMMNKIGSKKISKIIANVLHNIIEGEVSQLINCNNLNYSEKYYMHVIDRKTARLFEISACISTMLTETGLIYEKALKKYGYYLGMSFQIINDILDYNNSSNSIKEIGNDLKEKKITLPLIHAIKNSSKKQKNMLMQAFKQNKNISIDFVLEMMYEYGSLEWARNKAAKIADKAILALDILPESLWCSALQSLVNILIPRTEC